MKTYTDKTQRLPTLPAAQRVARLQRRPEPTFAFEDMRPAAAVQQQLQDVADLGAPARGIPQVQALADAGAGSQPRLRSGVERTTVPGATAVVQRKIGDSQNVVFGLEGKDANAIRSAIAAGYTTFDGADSYGNTIILLAAALRDAARQQNRRREDFEVIYKVDQTEPGDLMMHLYAIAERFDGYLDQVLIHKVTDGERAAAYGPVLSLLKRDGVVKAVGAGDVGAAMSGHFETMDSFEVNATELFHGPDHETLARNLDRTGKPVFVYNVIGALKSLLHMADRESPSQAQVMAMMVKIKALVGAAEPILSSSSAEKQAANLAVLNPRPDQEAAIGEAYKAIDSASAATEGAISITSMPADVATRVTETLFQGLDWAGERLFDDPRQYAVHREQCLKKFTPQELGVRYQGVREDKAKTFTLQKLVDMLFDASGNCHRVEASNFFMRGMGFL
jgi:diketogulonate reductase-like aldo/keto reductase